MDKATPRVRIHSEDQRIIVDDDCGQTLARIVTGAEHLAPVFVKAVNRDHLFEEMVKVLEIEIKRLKVLEGSQFLSEDYDFEIDKRIKELESILTKAKAAK